MKKAMICLAAIVAAACVKETPSLLHEQGSSISFGASTEWENDGNTRSRIVLGEEHSAPTRTEYSGKTENDAPISASGFSLERIDWSGGVDQIRILCQAAGGGHAMGGHADDYLITGSETNAAAKQNSRATGLAPAHGNGLQWGTGDHIFYAVYPAPGSKSPYPFGFEDTADDQKVQGMKVSIEDVNGKALVRGVVPSWQAVTKVGNVFKPNMNYAYMSAAKEVKANATGNVELEFKPLVTTIEFTLTQFADDPVADPLTRLELVSASGPLSNRIQNGSEYCTAMGRQANQYRTHNSNGDNTGFIATINKNNVLENVEYDPDYVLNTVRIDIPDGGVQLSDTPVKVTFLTLPLDQTDLTLHLYFKSNRSVKRTLSLKQGGAPITVGACKKAYIYNISVPGTFEYVFDSFAYQSYTHSGVNSQGDGVLSTSFRSYKQIGAGSHSVQIPLDYTIEFQDEVYEPLTGRNEILSPYSTQVPDWVGGIAGGTHTGYVEGEELSGITVSQQTPLIVKLDPATGYISDYGNSHHEAMVANGKHTTAYDLSAHNVATGATVAMTTANCYIVDRPGLYKFPVVYGNSISGGSENPSAYRTMIDGETDFCPADEGSGHAFGPTLNPGALEVVYLNNLRDHANAPIMTPYIVDQYPGGLDAKVVWMDEPGLISDVSVDDAGRWITFEVPEETIDQGNAVIAVTQGNTILWSWHIWFYEGDLTATKSAMPGFEFAPVPVGWCDWRAKFEKLRYCRIRITQNESGKQYVSTIRSTGWSEFYRGHAPFYQGGRKDPIPGILWDGYSQSHTKHLYDGEGNAMERDSWMGTTGGYGSAVDLGTAIQHPLQWYTGLYTDHIAGTWSNAQYVNLWNTYLYRDGTSAMQMGSWFAENPNKVVKTVYDPSPVGYQVPSIRAFYNDDTNHFTPENFTRTDGYGSYNDLHGTLYWPGRTYTSGLFFPSLGTRHECGDAVAQNSMSGTYWSVSPSNDGSFLSLQFGAMADANDYVSNPLSDDVHLFYFFGAPVMPVVESTAVR